MIDIKTLPLKIEFVAKTRLEDWDCFEWRCTLSSKAGSWSFPYYCGLAHVHKPKHQWGAPKPKAPSAESVFSALLRDASAEDQNFHDWCADLGYSDDSIKALNTYKSCLETAAMLRKHLGHEVVAELRDLLKDY